MSVQKKGKIMKCLIQNSFPHDPNSNMLCNKYLFTLFKAHFTGDFFLLQEEYFRLFYFGSLEIKIFTLAGTCYTYFDSKKVRERPDCQ